MMSVSKVQMERQRYTYRFSANLEALLEDIRGPSSPGNVVHGPGMCRARREQRFAWLLRDIFLSTGSAFELFCWHVNELSTFIVHSIWPGHCESAQ